MRLKKYACLLFCVLFAMQPTAAFSMSTISSVTRLDISDGSIKGENAEYTFVLPKSWQNGSIAVNREKPTLNSQFLDKLIFLYIPLDKISKPVAFATLYIYESRYDLRMAGYRKLLETDKYIFLFESMTTNSFTDIADRSLFGQHINTAANDSMMASQVEVPKSQRRINLNTVTVNGRLLRYPSIRNASGTVYIPVREACNALGYYVDWNQADGSITVYFANEQYMLSTIKTARTQNYPTIMIDDRAYVSSVFFMRALNANIEVDGNNNVTISSS